MADSNVGLKQAASPDRLIDSEQIGTGPTAVWRQRVELGGAALGDIVTVNGGELSVRLPSQLQVSTNNTTTTPLAPAGTFTGVADSLTGFPTLDVNFFASPATAKGTLFFEFSPDGTNWDVSVPLTVNDPTVVIPIPLRAILPFFRVRYVNGSVLQTAMRLTTVMHRTDAGNLTRTPSQVIGPSDPVQLVRALIEPSPLGERGLLGADREVFGAAIVSPRISEIAADFSTALVNNRVTSTVTGSGATAQANGQATLSTGVGVLASTARLESIKKVRYSPGREIYAIFTARFTTPVSAASEQRIGLYDDNNGFFLGYHGLTFGFTVRSGGSDTFTALTAANGDPLDGSFLSRFARGGVLEVFNPLNMNVWRIRFGWLGSSLQFFDLQSPDGLWMRVHSNRYPNLQTTPSIQSPNLPIRAEVIKPAVDVENLVIGTGSWNAGIVSDSYGLEPFDVKSREEVHASTTVTGTALAQKVIVYTPNTGRRFRLTDIQISSALKTGGGGECQLIDTASGGATPILWRWQLNPTTNTFETDGHSYKSPPGFTAGATFSVPASLNSLFTIVLDGYEEAA